MEIKIRNIDPSIVKEIDEKAKKNNVSRQVYLKDLIDNHVLMNQLNSREMEIKNTLDKNTEIIRLVGNQLEESTNVLKLLLEDD